MGEQEFSIRWSDSGSNIDSAAYILLDGFTVPGRFLHGYGSAQRDGYRVDKLHECRFMWTKADSGTRCRDKSSVGF